MQKKEHTYVECYWCHNNAHTERNCRHCQNTGKVINPLEILCNMCGDTMCPIGTMNEQTPHGLVDAKVVGGFDSYHLLDMNCYEFSFCEKCLRQMFMQCKIKPFVHGAWEHPVDGVTPLVHTSQQWTFEQDQESYEYRVWCDTGGHHQAYLDSKCNTIKNCNKKAIYTVWLSDEFTEDCCCEDHTIRWAHVVNAHLIKFISNTLKPFL